jgi:RNA polymerase sigma-70 factor (ECF subfamily)
MRAATLPGEIKGSVSQEFDDLFREHNRLVYRTAYGVTGSAEDAEDVLQTIFLRLLQREFPPDLQTNPKAYLFRAAVNVSLNTVRARKRRVLVADVEDLEVLTHRPQALPLEDLHRRLYEAIAGLDPEAAQILILRYIHNYSDAQIATLLGKSRGVIAVRLFRLRNRLRKLVKGERHEAQ